MSGSRAASSGGTDSSAWDPDAWGPGAWGPGACGPAVEGPDVWLWVEALLRTPCRADRTKRAQARRIFRSESTSGLDRARLSASSVPSWFSGIASMISIDRRSSVVRLTGAFADTLRTIPSNTGRPRRHLLPVVARRSASLAVPQVHAQPTTRPVEFSNCDTCRSARLPPRSSAGSSRGARPSSCPASPRRCALHTRAACPC